MPVSHMKVVSTEFVAPTTFKNNSKSCFHFLITAPYHFVPQRFVPYIMSHSYRPTLISSRSLRPCSFRPEFILSHTFRPKLIFSHTLHSKKKVFSRTLQKDFVDV
jgi:hypothetical protein